MPRGIVNQIPFLVGGEILLNPGFGLAPAPQHTWAGFNGQGSSAWAWMVGWVTSIRVLAQSARVQSLRHVSNSVAGESR